MNNPDRATENLIAAVLDTEEYKAYSAELKKVKQFPEVKALIDYFRKRNFELQTGAEIDFTKLDEFEREYQAIRENPMVADFLAAELELCKLMQRIHSRLIAALDFE